MKKMLSLMAMFLGIILMQSFSVTEARAVPPTSNLPGDCSGVFPGDENNPLRKVCVQTLNSSVGTPVAKDGGYGNDFKNQIDEDGLVNKVESADAKLDVCKQDDAYTKLANYFDTLESLYAVGLINPAKAKVSEAKYSELHGLVLNAQAYVDSFLCAQ